MEQKGVATKKSVSGKASRTPSFRHMSTKSSLRKKTISKSKSSRETTQEDLDDEEVKFLIVTSLRQDIVDKAMEVIYEKYLDRQTVYFVSHCSRLAWKSLIEWNYQRKDEGGLRKSDTEILDQEPEPSPKDSWAGHSIQLGENIGRLTTGTKKEPSPTFSFVQVSHEATQSTDRLEYQPTTDPRRKSLRQWPFRSPRPKAAGEKPQKYEETQQPLRKGKSLDFKKDSYELPFPVPLQAKAFPSSRVEVQFAVTPGARGLVSKSPPKTKTIRLHKSKSPVNKTLEDLSTKPAENLK